MNRRRRRLIAQRAELLDAGIPPDRLVPLDPPATGLDELAGGAGWPANLAGYSKALVAAGVAALVLVVAVLLNLGVVTTASIELAATTLGVLLGPANRRRPRA